MKSCIAVANWLYERKKKKPQSDARQARESRQKGGRLCAEENAMPIKENEKRKKTNKQLE